MNIGILGAGRIGENAARLFARAGHHVAISNSRGPETLTEVVRELGPNAQAMTTEDAVRFGEVVLVAVPWRKHDDLPPAELFQNKIVIDAMNAYGPGGPVDFSPSTSSEQIAKRLPGARLVKAFNTMNYEPLRTKGKKEKEGRLALFVAGDDAAAKEVVERLIDEIGFAPVDTGSLHEGGLKQQPNSAIYNKPMTAEQAQEILKQRA